MASQKLNVDITARLRNWDKALSGAQRKIQRFQRNMTRMGGELTRTLTLPLVAIGGAAIASAAKMERLELGLQTLMGSADAAKMELEKLRVIARNPGLTFDQAIQGSIQLQSVGFSADQTRDALEELSNAIALSGGTSDQLNRVTTQLQQMAGKGKIMEQEIRIISESLPQFRNAMQDAFGTASASEVTKLGLTVEDFVVGVTASLGKLERAPQTFSNAMVNFRTEIELSLAEIGKVIIENGNLTEVLNKVAGKIAEVAEWFKGLSDEAQNNILKWGLLAAAIGPVLIVLGKLPIVFTAIIAGLKNIIFLLGIITSPIGLAVIAIGALSAATIFLQNNMALLHVKIFNIWTDISNVIKTRINGIIGALNDFVEFLNLDNLFGQAKKFDLAEGVDESIIKYKSFGDVLRETREEFLKLLGLSGGGTVDEAGDDPGAPPIAPTAPPSPTLGVGSRDVGILDTIASKAANMGRVVSENVDLVVGKLPELSEAVIFSSDVIEAATTTAVEGMQRLATSTLSTFRDIAQALISLAKDIINAAIKTAVAKAIEATFISFFSKIGIFGGPGGIAAAAIAGKVASQAVGNVVAGVFNSVLSSINIPALAGGGLTTGPQLALVGDNPSGKEAIIPFEKMGSFLNQFRGGGEIKVTGYLVGRGSDLVAILENANDDAVKYRGEGINLG